jgi:RNA polymerase sigma-70 factor (ECF subfamily)
MADRTQQLIESATRGDVAAVEQLLDRYLPGLEAFVRLRSGKAILARESAGDLVQSICREVLQDLDDFHYENELHFKRWLYTTALRKIANRYEYYRAEKRDINKERPLDAGANTTNSSVGPERLLEAYRSVCTPSRQLMLKEELARVELAFEKLPDEYREIILLSKILGMSHGEVAQQLGKSEGATRSLLFRALGRLSSLLENA